MMNANVEPRLACTTVQDVTDENAGTSRSYDLVKLDSVFAFAATLAIILAPLRFGELQTLRPTTLIFIPSASYLILRNLHLLGAYFNSWQGIRTGVLFVLLTIGHFLGNDVMVGGENGDYSILSVESLIAIPLTFFCGCILAHRQELRAGVRLGLAAGLCFHVVSIGLVQNALTYRGYDRATGILDDPNILLLHVIPVFFMWRVLVEGSYGKWVAVGAIPFVVWATLQTLSRAGLAALGCGLLIILLGPVFVSRNRAARRNAFVTLLAVGTVLACLAWKTPDFLRERVDAYKTRTSERVIRTGSIVEDRLLWREDLQSRSFFEHLLHPVGMGYEEFQTDNPLLPHNTFIDVYIISGPLGAVLYIALFFGVFRHSLFGKRTLGEEDSLAHVYMFAFCATEVLLLLSLSVVSWKVNWLLLGIATGYINSRYVRNAQNSEST